MQFLKLRKLQLKVKIDLIWVNLAIKKLCEATKKRIRTICESLDDEAKEKLCKRSEKKTKKLYENLENDAQDNLCKSS